MKDPCQPVASCIAVGRPVVDFWLEHCDKYNVRRITREEALDIIKECRATGHINQAFFKVASGGSMGLICNCCPKCCVSMKATALAQKIKGGEDISQYVASGYKVNHDADKCKLCGDCAAVCHFKAIELKEGKWVYHEQACMGCELCVESCKQGALTLAWDETGLIPLDIDLVKEKLS